jgi:hypothetical protein
MLYKKGELMREFIFFCAITLVAAKISGRIKNLASKRLTNAVIFGKIPTYPHVSGFGNAFGIPRMTASLVRGGF